MEKKTRNNKQQFEEFQKNISHILNGTRINLTARGRSRHVARKKEIGYLTNAGGILELTVSQDYSTKRDMKFSYNVIIDVVILMSFTHIIIFKRKLTMNTCY